MSSLDNVIAAIRVAIPTYAGFDTKQELLNAYSVVDNPDTFLNNSWGLIVGSGGRASSDSLVDNHFITTERPISVVLCRHVYDVHGIGLQINEEVKSLFMDAKTVRDNFLNLSKFGELKSGEEIDYVGDSGVNFLEIDSGFKFIYTQIDFTFEIIETIN